MSNKNKSRGIGSAESRCWADREEAIRKIVSERDDLYAILVRISRETTCLQAPSQGTNVLPIKQHIYCFTTDEETHGRIKSLSLLDALRMLPFPTSLPPIYE